MRRGLRLLGVALLVVIAGCGAVGGGVDGSAVTVTPAAVPTDAPTATSGGSSPLERPPRSFNDPPAMVAAHRSVLGDASYHVVVTQTVRFPATNRTGRWELVFRGRPGGAFTVDTRRNGSVFSAGGPVRIGFWSDGEVVVEAFLGNDSVTANVVRDARGDPVAPRAVLPVDPRFEGELRTVFASTAIRSITRLPSAGTARVRVVATGPVGDDVVGSLALATQVRELRADLVIDERGFVPRYELRYAGTFGAEPVTVTRRVRYVAVGDVDIERPDWVDPALNGTAYATSSGSNGSS